MRSLFVLDTETTGLQGIRYGDKIVEVGIARVDLDRGRVFPEFGRIVHNDLNLQEKNSWVFQHTDLTPEDVMTSPWSVEEIGHELISHYGDKVFTAYNISFDFDSFLNHDPWSFRPRLAPCIMEESAARYSPEGRWFSAQAAYDMLCPSNPANLLDGREEHRALSDAVCEGYILLSLLEKNEEICERFVSVLEDSHD